MSNKSGTSVISLPKGGGALQGIGEKFSPDLFTGTGNFTVPIALPPGRNGFQPEINLVYSTGNGNSPFGMGWGLSIPGATRKTSKGIPKYQDYADDLKKRDTFILSGAEDLVPVENITPETTRYRPRTEGLFARIDHHHDAENDFWEVRSKDGLASYYGTPRPDNAPPDWQDPAIISDPSDSTKIFAWKLSRTEDLFGNHIFYEYERDSVEEEAHHWDQLYLKRIRYIDYTVENGDTAYLVSVTFIYEDRPDPFSDYRAGFEIRTRKRCNRIEIRTHADQERLVRSYHFVYLDQRDGMEGRLPLNGVSLLNRVKVVGHDDDRTEELPPLEFGYSQFEPEKRDFFPMTGADMPPGSLGRPEYEMADLFGNGLPDILQMNGTVRYWRNLGNGRFDLPREMRDAPAGLQLADPGVQMIDANGDGRVDLLVTTPERSGYFPLRFGGLWDHRSFRRYDMAPSFNLEDPEVKLLDLDGDGVTDALRSGTRLECYFNDPHKGWHGTRRVARQALNDFPKINFSDERVKWADMSGDGMQDIVLVYDGNIEYWPNLGYGDWGKRIHMENSPRFPYGYNPARILLGDVDGDGLADIVYVDDTKVTLWINQSGNGWSAPITIEGTPPVTDMDAVRLADMLGSGISGILWSADAGRLSRETMFFLDFSGGIKPYLLNEMNNHLGAVTRVKYEPSTHFYLEDAKRRETRWKTPLPFPVQVVAGVEVIDEISGGKLTTEYSYHHGYWDGGEREFRGFGRVEQRDTEVFETFHSQGLHPGKPFQPVDKKKFSPPLETRTWFHLGSVGEEFGEWEEVDFSDEYWPGDPPLLQRPQTMIDSLKKLPRRRDKRDALRTLRGNILRTELYARDGTIRQNRPYTVTESLQGFREEASVSGDDERLRIFFPHALAQRTTQWERGDDPMTQFNFTEDYDEYGQPRKQTQIACPRGWRTPQDELGEPFLATRTISEYAQPLDAQIYIADRVAKTTAYEIKNNGQLTLFELKDTPDSSSALEIIGQSLNFYDGPAFQGLPFGQVGDYGALVRTETLILTEEILHEAYRSADTVLDPPEIPPYLARSDPPPWTAEYPQEFRDLLPIQQSLDATRPGLHITPVGYGFPDNSPDSPYIRGYFSAAERRKYDFHENPLQTGPGLLIATRDPLGRDTGIEYDHYDMLPVRVSDPAGLITRADYDYRVLQPNQITDPNDNRTAYTFTTLGLLESTAVMGKEGQNAGDTLEAPGTRLLYDFLAFAERNQPVSVRTIQRVHHVHDTDVSLPERDETIEKAEYSDGFGRLLQSRSQAEDITFGDAAFGNGILPADQNIKPGNAILCQRAPGDPPNVVVSGWQVYDNKGRVVEKYEPFFSRGWEFLPPEEAHKGQKVTMIYDPRGQVIRTLNPNGSEQRVIYGVPGKIQEPALSNPDIFEPTPWEVYTYDENDNAGRTHPHDSDNYLHHWNTPSNVVMDGLGRAVESIERNGHNSAEMYITRSTYDIRGNLLTVIDPLGRLAFRYMYDLTPGSEEEEEQGAQVLRIEQLDAGLRRIVFDGLGNEIERRDSKDALILQAYDELNRPLRLWARDGQNQPVTLREHLIYGDSPATGFTNDQAKAKNLLGELYLHYDEAGSLLFESYDFKGNILEKSRQVISDDPILNVFANAAANNWQVQAYQVDWQPLAGVSFAAHAQNLLDSTGYQSSFTYDALNRIKTLQYPQDVDGQRKLLRPHYNRAGALERVTLYPSAPEGEGQGGDVYVQHIAYNAKGQRTLIVYGNGIMTRYAYDPETFQLARMYSEPFSQPNSLTYHSNGAAHQDFGYRYDLAGNITAIHDRTPNSGVPNTVLGRNALDRSFTYDPLYRLISATGRECDLPLPPQPWDDSPKCQDVNAVRDYRETYTYDAAGNLTLLNHKHTAGSGGFVRNFQLLPGTNRLNKVTVGNTDYRYGYDVNGNMVQENSERYFEWDHSDQMKVFRNQAGNAEPSVYAHYLYDADGQRVKKLVRKQGGEVEVTVYIDGLFEHRHLVKQAETRENNILHVMDDQKRIALIRVGAPLHPNDPAPAVQYHLGDHLGSSNLVINQDGAWINREEFTPYGETSFGSFAWKRYRVTGKERDEESGLDYCGARYYSAYNSKWLNVEPIFCDIGKTEKNSADRIYFIQNLFGQANSYSYAFNNPIRLIDTDGKLPILPLLMKAGTAGAADLMAQAAMNYFFDPNVTSIEQAFNNIDWIQVARSTAEGVIPWRVPGGRIGKAAATAIVDVLQAALTYRSAYTKKQAITDFAVGFISDLAGGGLGDLLDKYGSRVVARGLSKMGFDDKKIEQLITGAGTTWRGPVEYSDLPQPRNVGPGRPYAPSQKRRIRERNIERNRGYLRSDESGAFLEQPQQSRRGVTPSPMEAQIDHIYPRSRGGSNANRNAQVLSREENIRKSDNIGIPTR